MTLPHASNFTINHPGGQMLIHFPDTGNMRDCLTKVLTGKEYPLPQLEGYTPEVIVDIGANVGGTSLFFALNYPGARVLCYEPSPINLQFLGLNVRDLPRVEVFPFGLSDRNETARLYLGREQAMQSSQFRSIETGDGHEVAEFRKASEEFDARGLGRVSILKIDTEGCEVRILTDLGARLAEVELLYVEYHSEEDRRRIDELLTGDFVLLRAAAERVHRGSFLYLSRKLLQRYPNLDAQQIDTASR